MTCVARTPYTIRTATDFNLALNLTIFNLLQHPSDNFVHDVVQNIMRHFFATEITSKTRVSLKKSAASASSFF